MRTALAMVGAAVWLAGCASPPPAAPPKPKPVVTPDLRPVGTVVLVNTDARFAVVNFPNGAVPQAGRMLAVFHNGMKSADLRVTGPQRENITVGDILDGTPQPRDEVRFE